jgi:hypothetical protein
MARKPRTRLVRAITDAMWRRDERQMRAINALLSAARPVRKRARKLARRAKKAR